MSFVDAARRSTECPSCGHNNTTIHSVALSIRRCSFCGLLYKIISSNELTGIHKNAWAIFPGNEDEAGGTDLRLARIYVKKLLSVLGLKNFAGLRVLDFGAGRGNMLTALSESGADVYGVEPFGYEYLKGKGFKVFQGLENIPKGLTFDGVIASDVIEHIFYPQNTLKELHGFLNSCGWLYIATPNAGSLKAKVLISYWREFIKQCHVRFFDSVCIEAMFTRLGIVRYNRLNWFVRYSNNPLKGLIHAILTLLRLEGELRYILFNSGLKTEKPVISLVSLPTRANYRYIPIALICLAAWLDKEGISNIIMDEKIERDPFIPLKKEDIEYISNEIIDKIRDARPVFVGIPCYTADYQIVMSLAKRIKEECGVKIIVGGLHATLQHEDFLLENSPVDFVVIGEGEITLSELIKASLHGSPMENVNGIAFRKGSQIITTKSRERIADLSILPRPAYEKIDMEYYLKPNRYIVRLLLLSGVHIFTTRGCPNQCTFCANRMRKVTYRAPKDVVEEIRWLKENCSIDSFYIADDTFCLKKERVFEFTELMNKLPYKLAWAMETTVKSVDEQMVREMKKAGCIQIDFGVESGSQDALNRMKKGITIEQVENAFKLCRKYGIRTFPTFMFNTPEETEDDVVKTIGLMKKIKATNYGINLTVPYLGTEIYEKYVFPKLTREEYDIYADPDLYHTIPDKRFLLAKHNLNLDKLYIKTLLQFTFFRKVLDLTLNNDYWRAVLNSKRRNDYILFLFGVFKRQFKVFWHYSARFVSISGRKARGKRS